MSKQSNNLHLPLVILAVLALAFVPILLSLNKKITQPKAQACTTNECSTATGCQLTGYPMTVNGVTYTCAGNNTWTDPDGNTYGGDLDGPVVLPADQAVSEPADTSFVSAFTAELVDDPDGDPEMSVIQVTNSETGETTTVGDKMNRQLYPVAFVDPAGQYVGVTTVAEFTGEVVEKGQLSKRTAAVYRRDTQEKILDSLCTTGVFTLFWKSFLVFDSCETQDNRPWSGNFAPSIIAHNLGNGEKAYISQSSPTEQFRTLRVVGDTLVFVRSMNEGQTWDLPESTTSTEVSVNLFDILQ